ncbi:helix-turn-helix transcriptional regulator [Streptomyces phaeochromogenes]|uniref:Helix-turn-helix transcriptional regulator n=1 Tax=Streptomyces phaeochromogenes TaxID=1923 RepID=A0ABZ1HD05_STRPH|nr:helix-turn-helix transcriptional regulator [Streptomyces phaeochromogenes]WRZ30455.1 helix-turn-helix transcriptional regulator [Streptomyces phaeochromogenes]WSD16055.1 helix-turn-helix transcriptional regulator [Streptomyces phaeochromogenes]WSJ07113.1 helix-turn-helix transcriptional regulator [Streptomyces phaeochromogenes]
MAGPKDLDPSSSPRALIGAELRHARERKGLSQSELGEPLFVSGSFIGQLEAGTRRLHLEYAAQIDEILDTNGFFERNCKALAKSKYPDHFAEAAEAEAIATAIREYATLLIPGLLQTRAYAEAVFRAYKPTAPKAEIDPLVAARLERAHLLDDPTTPLLWAILDEAAIRREVGSGAVMGEALQHVAKLTREHRIIVQVLPFDAGAHASMTGALKLMEFEDAPSLSFVEGPDMGKLLDDPATVARHTLTFDLLQAAAHSPQDSLALLESVAQDYEHGAQHP